MPKTYKDGISELKGHRMQLFDIGYQDAAVIDLLVQNQNLLTYQYRAEVRSLVHYLRQCTFKNLSVVIISKPLAVSPILLAFYLKEIQRITFYLGQTVDNYKPNPLVNYLGRKINHYIDSDYDELIDLCMRDSKNIVALIDCGDEELVRKVITRASSSSVKRISLFNYALLSTGSQYFLAQKMGIHIEEYMDGRGVFMRYDI